MNDKLFNAMIKDFINECDSYKWQGDTVYAVFAHMLKTMREDDFQFYVEKSLEWNRMSAEEKNEKIYEINKFIYDFHKRG